MEPQANVQEQIVPSNQLESDTGDWGPDALELEQQLLDQTKEPIEGEGTPTGNEEEPPAPAVENVPIQAAPPPQSDAPLFDINGKLSVQAGQPLTAEHVKELERGWLRERDYTHKTQQVAEIRQAAQQILDASEQINQDPRALRQYFKDEHILSAFDKKEMLHYGLSSAGVTPQVWNQFLEWYREAGFQPQQGGQLPSADPYVQQFGALNQRLEQMGKTLEQFQAEKQQRVEMEARAQQESAYNAEMERIGKEVDAALKNHPDVDKEDLLIEMARSDGTRSVAELAKAVQNRYEARYNAYVEKKKQVKQNAPKPPKGQSVNIVQRAPKTFEEADALIDQAYGTGSLKPRG